MLHLHTIRLLQPAIQLPDAPRWNVPNRPRNRKGQKWTKEALFDALDTGMSKDGKTRLVWEFTWDSIMDRMDRAALTKTRQRIMLCSLVDTVYMGERVSVQHGPRAPRYVPRDPPLHVRRVGDMSQESISALLAGVDMNVGYLVALMYDGDYMEEMAGRIMFDLSVFDDYAPWTREAPRASFAAPRDIALEPAFLRSISERQHVYRPTLRPTTYGYYERDLQEVRTYQVEDLSTDGEDDIPEAAKVVCLYLFPCIRTFTLIISCTHVYSTFTLLSGSFI